jgi:hypothetical protein
MARLRLFPGPSAGPARQGVSDQIADRQSKPADRVVCRFSALENCHRAGEATSLDRGAADHRADFRPAGGPDYPSPAPAPFFAAGLLVARSSSKSSGLNVRAAASISAGLDAAL